MPQRPCAVASPLHRPTAGWLLALVLPTLVAAPAVLHPACALAEPSDAELRKAEAKAIEAKAYFKQGLYQEAAEKFMEAFAISRKADTMFNAARAYEQAGKRRQALALFRQYLDLPDASDDGKADARARIAALEAAVAAEPSEPDPLPPEDARASAPLAKAAPTGSTTAPLTAKTAPAGRSVDGRSVDGLSVVLWASGAIVAALGAASWAGGVQKARDANAMDFSQPNARANYNTAFDEAEAGQTFGIFLTVVGAGAIGWGTWRFLSSKPKSASGKPSVWLSPVRDGAVGGLTWSL